MPDNNGNTNNNKGDGKGGDAGTNNNTKPNADGGDTTNKGGGDKGGDKTIPVESYNIVRDKYQDAKSKLEAIEKAQADAETKRLEAEGKFKEVAANEKARADKMQTRYERTAKVNALKLAAIQAGTVDADAVEQLADLNAVKLSEDGSIEKTSVDAVIESLKKSKAYLFGEKPKPNNVGASGGSPSDGGGDSIKTFKRSQLRDSSFYKENEKDILAAAAAGKIVDDITPR